MADSADSPVNFNGSATDWPSVETLELGRFHGRTRVMKGGGLKEDPVANWHLVPLGPNRDRMMGQAMPTNATLCQACFKLSMTESEDAERRRALAIILGPEEEGGQLRARMVRFFAPLSSHVVCAFAAWATLRYWLEQPTESGVKLRAHADVWRLRGSAENGRVHNVAGMAAIMPGFVQMLLELAGSMVDAVQHLVEFDGFWSAVGAQFSEMLDGVINSNDGRLARIKAGTLTALTPWVEDWWSLPKRLRDFMHEAVAGARERVVWKEALYRPRVEQKFRAIYTSTQILMHAINPACNEPLHASLHRIAAYNGRTVDFRRFLGRLGVIVSERLGREKQEEDAKLSGPARVEFVHTALTARRYLMLVDDNLDWEGPTSREHQIENAGKARGVHVLNSQAHEMRRPDHPNFETLSPDSRALREVEAHEILECDVAEQAALEAFTESNRQKPMPPRQVEEPTNR